MTSTNSTGNPPDVAQEEVALPGFVSKRPDGVYINLPRLHANGGFEIFVDRLFSGGGRFQNLDYDTFLKLLYDADWLATMQEKCPDMKIASEIVRFLPQRKALYRPVKILEGGKRADYMFEPVSIEVIVDEPVYGTPNEEGVASIVRHERKTITQPAKLDFDEFVADMWLKGVKFGIDAERVAPVISSGTTIRMTIARDVEPTEGRDAEIKEACAGLHRDNSPKILANGKADLGVFANRFPQIAKGARLLQKVPRALGKRGWMVTGEVVEPSIPKDLDLSALASVGTRVEHGPEGEFIVATLDGFLTLDAKSNSVSVTEKIESKAGISVKTTGDLALGVDEFIEHGEVQEGRVVRGKHMTFLSNVYGSLVSQDGNIRIEGNLSGGSAETLGGDIALGGRVSRAVVRAREGAVTAKYCESSTIVGKNVWVEQAVNCEIVADEVFAESLEGCMIAAKKIKIVSADERRGRETSVTVLIPDLSGFQQGIAKLEKDIADAQAGIGGKMREIESLKSEAEFAKYLALNERIKSGAIKLTPEQALNWQKLVEKHAKTASQVARLETEINVLDQAHKESEKELSYLMRDRDVMGEGVSCVIDKVVGHSTVQTMKSGTGAEIFSGMSGNDIRALLQKTDGNKARIFSGDEGAVRWSLKGPVE